VVHITIDTASREEAEKLASSLPGQPAATSVRGYGLIRTRCRSEREVSNLLDAVDDVVRRHSLLWARVRRGDEEHMFRGSVSRAS
jgi:hypothetical protein